MFSLGAMMIHSLIGHPSSNTKMNFKDVDENKMKKFIEKSFGETEIDKFLKNVLPRMVTHDYGSRISTQELGLELLEFVSFQHIY